MLKKILFSLLALFAAAAFSAVDVNKATQAELETVKGIGPAIAGKILDARKTAAFKDWTDLIERVKGVGEGNAAKYSEAGLTVGAASYKGTAPAAKKDEAAKPAKAAASTAEDKAAAKKAAADEKKAAKAKKADAAADAASKPAKK
jgi:competence protein ComEA